jgi:hypothetical protein
MGTYAAQCMHSNNLCEKPFMFEMFAHMTRFFGHKVRDTFLGSMTVFILINMLVHEGRVAREIQRPRIEQQPRDCGQDICRPIWFVYENM